MKQRFPYTNFILLMMLILALCGCGGQKRGDAGEPETSPETAISSEPKDVQTQETTPEPETTQTPETASSQDPSQILDPQPEAETQPESEPAPPSFTILMVGDILLHDPVEKSALQEDNHYNFSSIFSNTEEIIRSADLALVNQEVILGGSELGISGYPAFNAPYEAGDALADAGFDVICHATNHALDKGRKGLLNCISYWQESHPEIAVLGIHENEESAGSQPYIFTFPDSDISIAILNYTYGTNGIPLPDGMPYAVDCLEEEKVISDIKKAEELADFTVVCPHWGTEYRLEPDSMQKKWTKLFLENGVDLVLGTHPHVIEPVEWVTDEDSGEEMLVYYSLGNFVNWTSGRGAGVANRMVGGMAQITLSKDESDAVVISDYGITALVCHLTAEKGGVTVYPLSEYTEELAAQNAITLQDGNFSKAYCTDLCDRVWGTLWGQ